MADENVNGSDDLLRSGSAGLSAPAFFVAPQEEDNSGPSAFGGSGSFDMGNDFMSNAGDGADGTGDDSVNSEFAAAFGSGGKSSRPATPTMNINASLLDDDSDEPLAIPVTPVEVVAETVAVSETPAGATLDSGAPSLAAFPAPTGEPEDEAPSTADSAEDAPAPSEGSSKSSKKVLVYGLVAAVVVAAGAAAYTLLG